MLIHVNLEPLAIPLFFQSETLFRTLYRNEPRRKEDTPPVSRPDGTSVRRHRRPIPGS